MLTHIAQYTLHTTCTKQNHIYQHFIYYHHIYQSKARYLLYHSFSTLVLAIIGVKRGYTTVQYNLGLAVGLGRDTVRVRVRRRVRVVRRVRVRDRVRDRGGQNRRAGTCTRQCIYALNPRSAVVCEQEHFIFFKGEGRGQDIYQVPVALPGIYSKGCPEVVYQ